MSNKQKSISRTELEKKIIKKATEDANFKKTLLDHPKRTLEQLGFPVAKEVEVKVVEESAKVIYLVLPVNPDELTDEQLAPGAGGDTLECGDREVLANVCRLERCWF